MKWLVMYGGDFKGVFQAAGRRKAARQRGAGEKPGTDNQVSEGAKQNRE